MYIKKLAFTLVELIIVIAIITLLAGIIVVTINPQTIFINARNAQRANDLSTFQTAFNRYFAESYSNTVSRKYSDFTGFNSLLSNALAGTGGLCPNGINGSNLSSVTGAYDLNTSGSSFMDITPLINNNYLNKPLTDPLGNIPYKACIDTLNRNSLILFTSNIEGTGTPKYISIETNALNPTGQYFVQGKVNTAPSCGIHTLATAFSNSVNSGNLIVVSTHDWDNTANTISGITDNKGNTYSFIHTRGDSAGYGDHISVWYATNVTGGPITITATSQSSSGCITMAINEYAGVTNTDQIWSNSNVSQNNTPDSGNNGPTTSANELIYGTFAQFGGVDHITPSTGFIQRNEQPDDNGGGSIYTIDKFVNTTGSYKVNGTWQSPEFWVAIYVSFK